MNTADIKTTATRNTKTVKPSHSGDVTTNQDQLNIPVNFNVARSMKIASSGPNIKIR